MLASGGDWSVKHMVVVGNKSTLNFIRLADSRDGYHFVINLPWQRPQQFYSFLLPFVPVDALRRVLYASYTSQDR